MDDLVALSSQLASVIGDLDAEPVLRGVEVVCSMISWAVLSSAHRDGYGGVYQYDHYTPLNFLLTAGILHWGFVLGIVLVKHSTLLEQDLLEKCELYGTGAMLGFAYTASIAGAASSTQNHDQFDGKYSTCSPRHQKRIAYYFCSRVGVSVAFSFFATAAAAGSLALVVAKQRSRRDTSPSSTPGAYNPIDGVIDDDGVDEMSLSSKYPAATTVSPAYGVPMDAVGSDSSQQHSPDDLAVDL